MGEKIPGDFVILMALQMQLCNWKADVIHESMLPLPSVEKNRNLFTDRMLADTSISEIIPGNLCTD